MIMVLSQNGRQLSRIERLINAARGDRGKKKTLSPCPGEPVTAGGERLAVLTPAVSLAHAMVIPHADDRRWRMVDFQAINYCSNAGHRGYSRQEFFYLMRRN
jgi:hypothetical protein